MTTTMTHDNLRLKAEWEPQQYVMLTLPDSGTDWEYMLPEVHECYKNLLRALTRNRVTVKMLARNPAEAMHMFDEDTLRGVTLVEMEYNDTWIRDYGPLSLGLTSCDGAERTLLADFGFNGWGLKFASDLDNLATWRCFARKEDGSPNPAYLNCRALELEGGAVESDGKGTLLTTTRCLCSPNRNGGLTKEQVEKRLAPLLGVTNFLWLDHGYLAGDDTDSHVDTLARLCPGDVIIYTGAPAEDDEHHTELTLMRKDLESLRTVQGRPFSLVELPFPSPVFDKDDGHRLPATYANYLVTDHVVLVPAYGRDAEDELARKIIESVYSDRKVESVDCRALIRQHGSLHCATMQISK